MKILLLSTSYNSLTQRLHADLNQLNHRVYICLSSDYDSVRQIINQNIPDIIICPFLKEKIPRDIWEKNLCIVIHPGIKGDRGCSSLDWAILNQEKEWGVTALQAVEKFDAGPIWASHTFPMPSTTKSKLYRGLITQAAVSCVHEVLEKLSDPNYEAQSLDYSSADIKGIYRPAMKQEDRKIDWSEDDTNTIIRKINTADSNPGILESFGGEEYFLYNACPEEKLTGEYKEIVAHKNGAVCVATIDGAIWISHLKKSDNSSTAIKLPATLLLQKQLENIPEIKDNSYQKKVYKSFQDIYYEEENDTGYLYFDVLSGAMGVEKCQHILRAYNQLVERGNKVIVLLGGSDFFSNGIDLNQVEASANPAQQSWENINAINDLVESILRTDSAITISVLRGNAAAGGVSLAMSTDLVFASNEVVLNPHYKTMGLYGSEFWTYIWPKRMGEMKTIELMEKCLPINASHAKQIGMIDKIFSVNINLLSEVKMIARQIASANEFSELIQEKKKRRDSDEEHKPLSSYRKEELEHMHKIFFDPASKYHTKRASFVSKVKLLSLPGFLQRNNEQARTKPKDSSPRVHKKWNIHKYVA